MTDIESPVVPKQTVAEIAFTIFLRVVALTCLVAGLKYWLALIGIFDYPPWRFDLMPVHWRLAATSLAVLFPVAATGLWLTVSWGPVIWVAAAAIEATMYVGFPDLFGRELWIPMLHAVVAAIYVALRVVLYVQRRHRIETVTADSL